MIEAIEAAISSGYVSARTVLALHFGRVEAAGFRRPEGRKGLFTPFLYPNVLLVGSFGLDLV